MSGYPPGSVAPNQQDYNAANQHYSQQQQQHMQQSYIQSQNNPYSMSQTSGAPGSPAPPPQGPGQQHPQIASSPQMPQYHHQHQPMMQQQRPPSQSPHVASGSPAPFSPAPSSTSSGPTPTPPPPQQHQPPSNIPNSMYPSYPPQHAGAVSGNVRPPYSSPQVPGPAYSPGATQQPVQYGHHSGYHPQMQSNSNYPGVGAPNAAPHMQGQPPMSYVGQRPGPNYQPQPNAYSQQQQAQGPQQFYPNQPAQHQVSPNTAGVGPVPPSNPVNVATSSAPVNPSIYGQSSAPGVPGYQASAENTASMRQQPQPATSSSIPMASASPVAMQRAPLGLPSGAAPPGYFPQGASQSGQQPHTPMHYTPYRQFSTQDLQGMYTALTQMQEKGMSDDPKYHSLLKYYRHAQIQHQQQQQYHQQQRYYQQQMMQQKPTSHPGSAGMIQQGGGPPSPSYASVVPQPTSSQPLVAQQAKSPSTLPDAAVSFLNLYRMLFYHF